MADGSGNEKLFSVAIPTASLSGALTWLVGEGLIRISDLHTFEQEVIDSVHFKTNPWVVPVISDGMPQ